MRQEVDPHRCDISSSLSGSRDVNVGQIISAVVRAAGGLRLPLRTGGSHSGLSSGGGATSDAAAGRIRNPVSRVSSGLASFGSFIRSNGLQFALDHIGVEDLRGRPATEIIATVAEHLAEGISGTQSEIVCSGAERTETRNLQRGIQCYQTVLWDIDFKALRDRGCGLLIVSSKSPKIVPAGFALASARLVGCRPMVRSDEKAARCDWYDGAYSWILEDIQRIEPFPVRGKLGLYEVDESARNI